MGSAKMGSLYNVRPGVLGHIHQQTIWSLWDTPAHAHLPIAQLDLTLWESMDCSLPAFSAHGILQAVGSHSLFQEIVLTQADFFTI